MSRLPLLLTICIALTLAACASPTPGAAPAATATPAAGTGFAVSTTVVTVMPAIIATLPPVDFTPPAAPLPPTLTPIPALPGGGLGPTELKYRLLAQYPDLFFCDPDYYPVARSNEIDLARQHFPELQANAEEFNAILAHNNLPVQPSYTDEQKILIYREHKKLAAVQFTPAGNGYRFQIQVSKAKSQGELITGVISGTGEITVEQSQATIANMYIVTRVSAVGLL